MTETIERTPLRWMAPAAIVVPWLVLLTSRQAALFPASGTGPEPMSLAGVAIVAIAAAGAILLRSWRPTVPTHVLALAVSTCGIALLAAQIGMPLANATVDYCGDVCRSAIFARFVVFFGWPILTAGVLYAVSRAETTEWSSWTRPWAAITLIAGLSAAVAWWRIILPDG